MLSALFWFAVGLIVGWNLIPQPELVKNLYDKARGEVIIQQNNKEEQSR